MVKKIIGLCLAAFLIAGCAPSVNDNAKDELSVDELKEALREFNAQGFQQQVSTVYNIFPIAFADANGDNHGDLRGIIAKLDYLNDGDPTTVTDLGITAIWLNPIHPSPSYHKYDVLDYMAIDRKFGTKADFKELVAEANKRGIHIIMDLVFNHSGFDHPWFRSALSGEEPYRDFYRFETQLPNDIFPNQTGWHTFNGLHYYGSFYKGMPEFNLDNPLLRKKFKEIITFWFELGVTGIRYDAVKHAYDRREWPEGTPLLQKNLQFWMTMQHHAKSINPNAFIVAEMWDSNTAMQPWAQAFDALFNFDFGDLVVNAVNAGTGSQLMPTHLRNVENLKARNPHFVDAPFLRNHDQNRIFNDLNFNVDKMRLASVLLLTQEGIPFIYYGEELGMRGRKPDERIREPMRWNDRIFSEVAYWTSWQYNAETLTVEQQDQDPQSLLNHYRQLIHLRHQTQALRFGSTQNFHVSNPSIVAYTRAVATETIVVIVNLSSATMTGKDQNNMLDGMETLKAYGTFAVNEDHQFTISPRGFIIGRISP